MNLLLSVNFSMFLVLIMIAGRGLQPRPKCFDCRTGFRIAMIAGRGLQPRPKCFDCRTGFRIAMIAGRGYDCRTGFATPSEMFRLIIAENYHCRTGL